MLANAENKFTENLCAFTIYRTNGHLGKQTHLLWLRKIETEFEGKVLN